MTDIAKDYPLMLVHELGCGQPAFLLKDAINWDGPLKSSEAAALDGQPMSKCPQIVCGSCGDALGGLDLQRQYVKSRTPPLTGTPS